MKSKPKFTELNMEGLWNILFWSLLFSCQFKFSYESKAHFVFVQEPENIAIVTGKNASLHCKANAADRAITYFWKFNGSLIYGDNNNGFRAAGESLYIHNVAGGRHNGVYECIAFTKDLGAIISKAAKLQTAYFASVSYPKDEGRLNIPRPYLIKAPTYKAYPPPTFSWVYTSKHSYTYVNISKPHMAVTSEGDLLVVAVNYGFITDYRVNVFHPTVENSFADQYVFYLRNGKDEPLCGKPSMISFPTKTNKTVFEGSSVAFDCLAVARSCYGPISINWNTRGRYLNETSRTLVLKDVTKKSHEGTYECQAKKVKEGTTINITYVLNVIEKPVLLKVVPAKVNLPADGILHPAVVSKAKSLTWYKDGYAINSKSPLYDVLSNGKLRFKHPSPAFNGIYQMFYQNEAGVTVVSQEVNVDSKAGCGWKIFTSSGTISYTHNTPTWGDTICTWLFHLRSTQLIKFRIRKFSFQNQATFSVYEGSMASKDSLGKYFFNVAQARGPFISLVLRLKALSVGRFTVDYWPMSQGPPTTAAAKPTTSNPTTSEPTTIKPAKTIKPTKKKPVKGKQKVGKGGSKTGAIVGGIFGVLVLIALIVLVVYREKVLEKCGRSGSANVKTGEPTSVPMLEVDTSKQAC